MPSIHAITSSTRNAEICSGRSASPTRSTATGDATLRRRREGPPEPDSEEPARCPGPGSPPKPQIGNSRGVWAGDQVRRLHPGEPRQSPQGRFQVPAPPSRGERVRYVKPGPDPGPPPSEGRSVPLLSCRGSPASPPLGPPPTGGGAGRSRSPRGLRSDLVRRGFVPISRGRRRISRGRQASSGPDRVLHPCPRRSCRATRSRNRRCGPESGWQ